MTKPTVTQVMQTLAAAIHRGELAPGTALPTHRQLAARHGIAIASASKIYAQLKAQGLVVGETGRGTFVRARPLHREWDSGDEARLSAQAVDLSFNHPTWPGQADLLRTLLRDLAGTGDLAALMHQQPPGGRRHEREIVAEFLARERGIAVDAPRIVFVNGAQQGLDVAARALLSPHDRVAVDALTYPGWKMVAQARPLGLQPVPARHDGPDLDVLDALCRRHPIRAIYTMPTLHNPLGWVLSLAQRERLVAVARRHDCLLIEDAAYAYLAGRTPAPLVTLAPERTVYVSSLSKSVASGLRFGYMVVPPACAARIKAQVRASAWSVPSLITAMATRWIQDGTVTRLEALHRRDAARRQAIARQAFARLPMLAHPASLFVWLPLPDALRADPIARALAEQQIAVSKGEAYATTRHAPQALRLALGSVKLEALGEVLGQVRAVIDQYPT